ncbi:hypothetical protein MRX96_041840 [Rhipicephalus microplus]
MKIGAGRLLFPISPSSLSIAPREVAVKTTPPPSNDGALHTRMQSHAALHSARRRVAVHFPSVTLAGALVKMAYALPILLNTRCGLGA